jgi:hypothetical protein
LVANRIDQEVKETLRRDVLESLKSLGLSSDFKLTIHHTSADSIAFVIARRSEVSQYACEAITVRGNQCRLEREPNECLCKFHLTMSKER